MKKRKRAAVVTNSFSNSYFFLGVGFSCIDYTIHKIKSVVIDAGHGGKDPGAISRNGLKEKKVNKARTNEINARIVIVKMTLLFFFDLIFRNIISTELFWDEIINNLNWFSTSCFYSM